MGGASVSVIMVTCDRPALLADALRSVAAQSRPPLEVRLADDGQVPALGALPELPILELTARSVRAGQAAAARNEAARGARGDVLAFLDDDDRWTPDHLAGLIPAFDDPSVGFAWRDSVVIRERIASDGRRIELERATLARDWDDALMHSDDYLPPSAWAVRRDLFESLGGFDTTFRYSEDWDLVLRLASATRVRRMPGVSVEVRLREQGNASADRNEERLDCLARLASRHGLRPIAPKTFWEVALCVAAAPPA